MRKHTNAIINFFREQRGSLGSRNNDQNSNHLQQNGRFTVSIDGKNSVDSKKEQPPKMAVQSEKLVCLFDESPYFILKVAAQGNVNEVKRLVEEDRKRLATRDYRGQNVVHHAVTWGRIAVLDYLETCGIPDPVDINAQDKLGNTPLHWATEKNKLAAAQWLLARNCQLDLKNIQHQPAIHYAVELGRIEIVRAIVKEFPRAVDLPGDLGSTALHVAAAKDLPEIAHLLLEHGSDLLKRDDTGCPPIHSATRHGSAQVIDVLIEFAEQRGMSSKSLIHMPDKDNNFPLHTATNSGNIKSVKVCLRAGADIDSQQIMDHQTPVHYAAAQGGYEMISLMLDAQPDKRENCLHCRDILEQTPLHKAAMLNHVKVVEQLIDEGASINAQDAQRRTPLLLAATKNASLAVNCLLRRRANTTLRDKDNRNFLHLLIVNGSKLREIDMSGVRNLKQLLNEQDDFGCTPMLYASKAGQLGTLRGLLELGAMVTLKDNDKKTALHVAAKHGRLQTCRNLLASENGALLINETDGAGRTPLHIASQYGYFKEIALFVRKGALINKDFKQNTPLHLAAENGQYDAVVLLVGLAPHLMNSMNKVGNTALHLAAANGHAIVIDYLMTAEAEFLRNNDGASFFDLAIAKFQSDAAAAVVNHHRYKEAMDLTSTFGTPLIGLIQHLPRIALLFLDKCLTYSADNKRNRNYCISYDFQYLQTPNRLDDILTGIEPTALLPLNMMVKFNRVDLLSHPVCVTFLKQKWNTFGSLVYNFRIGLYLLFLALLTSVALDIDDSVVVTTVAMNSTEKGASSHYYHDLTLKEINKDLFIRMLLVATFCAINVIIHLGTMIQQKYSYFLEFTHYLEWTLYVSTFMAILPFYLNEEDTFNPRVQLTAAAISLLLGWIIFLLYLQRFDFFGIYVVMFIEIFKTLMRALVVFSFVIIAFGLSFSMVFRTTGEPTIEFLNPWVSLMSTLSMMAGEVNYVHIITPTLNGDRKLVYGDLTYIIFVAFLVLVPTLLMNLLVGLAVGDIESVQKNARLKRLATQVEYFTVLEKKLPKAFTRRYMLTEYKCYPNRSQYEILEAFRSLRKEACQVDLDEYHDLDGDMDSHKNEISYIIEEMTTQSRQMNSLLSKIESQHELLKLVMQKMENGGSIEDDDEDDEAIDDPRRARRMSSASDDRAKESSTQFRSLGSRAHWHALSARMAVQKKPKATQLWNSNSNDERPNPLTAKQPGNNSPTSILGE